VDVDRVAAAAAQHRRTPREHPRREIVNAVLYLLRTGCSWRRLPHDLPPWQTLYWYFKRWRDGGGVDRVHDALRDRLRDRAGRDPMASAGIVDAQSVKGADAVGRAWRGYDAGKRVNGRKRRVVVDTLGLLLVVMVTAANLQDRDGGKLALQRLRFATPSVATVFADGGYAGRLVGYAGQVLRVAVEAVHKPARAARLRGPAPPLGGGTQLGLDPAPPPPRPRLRTTNRQRRSDDEVGHDRRQTRRLAPVPADLPGSPRPPHNPISNTLPVGRSPSVYQRRGRQGATRREASSRSGTARRGRCARPPVAWSARRT